VLLYLASLLLFLASSEDRRRSRNAYLASIGLFACALFSKAAAITLPAAVLLVMWARGAVDRRLWPALVPYLAIAIGAGLGLLSSVPTGLQVPRLATRLTLPPRILAFYVVKFLWPTGLLPMYPRWPLPAPAASDFLPWVGVAAVAALIVVLWTRLPRLVLFGIGFFLVNIALVLGVSWFTYFDHSLVGDHLAYLPSLGLAFAVVAGVTALASAARLPATVPTGALALVCAVLGVLAWRQIPVWHDTETLWTYTIARNPECATCQYNLGLLLEERGDLDAAAAHYERSLRIRDDSEPAINLGNVRVAQGRLDDARAIYQRATEIDSKSEKAWYNLGLVLARQGQPAEAIARYRQAIRLAPKFADAHRSLGEALLQAEKADEARAEFETTLRLAPGDRDAERGLGRVAIDREQWEEAVTHYERALAGIEGDPMTARTHRELATVLDALGRSEHALRQYAMASRLAPDDIDALNDFATALATNGRVGDAVAFLQARLARTPDVPAVANQLAWIHATNPDARWRNGTEAVRLAEHACALTGYRDPDLLDTLAAAYAAAGRFDDAVKIGRRAVEAASGNSEQAAEIRARVASYEAGQPYTAPQ